MQRTSPFYSKRLIINLVEAGSLEVTEDALDDADKAFGWKLAEIEEALKQLNPDDWYNSRRHYNHPEVWVDYYRCQDLNGEGVYTHFHVIEGVLYVDSFKGL